MGLTDEKYQTTFSLSGIDSLQFLRHVVQLIVFIAINAKLIGLSSTVILVPYLHSSQAPWSTAIGAYDALEYGIAHSVVPLLAVGVIYLTGITVGRVFCGWACPMGMFQDFLSYLPVTKQRISTNTSNSIRDIKWAVVAFSIIVSLLIGFRRQSLTIDSPMGVFADSPFSVISPSATLFTYIPWMFLWKSDVLSNLGALGFFKMGILVAILAPSIYIPRFFCRFICPLGALYEPLSKYKMLRLYKNPKQSNHELNKVLADVCPMGVQLGNEDSEFIDNGGCVHCGRCVTESPKPLTQKIC